YCGDRGGEPHEAGAGRDHDGKKQQPDDDGTADVAPLGAVVVARLQGGDHQPECLGGPAVARGHIAHEAAQHLPYAVQRTAQPAARSRISVSVIWRSTSAGLWRSRMREVSTGSGASSNTTRSSRAAQTAYVASHQGSARPFCRRGWPNTRSQLSANTGPSSSTTTAARPTRRPTNRRNALRRTICFSSSRGSARVTTQSRNSRGSERTALSISSV